MKAINTILSCCTQTTLLILTVLNIFTYPSSFCGQIKSDEGKKMEKVSLRYNTTDFKYAEMLKKKQYFQKHIKFILLWHKDSSELDLFEDKQKVFLRYNCPNVNCYVTKNRNFFGGELKKFDAVVFNGPTMDASIGDLPKIRYNHQKYTFVSTESGAMYPICNPFYDNYFNWTFTYRLDSDIFYPYFHIKDKNNNIVGPSTSMKWTFSDFHDNELESLLNKKQKAAAWMVSHCSTFNKREEFVNLLAYTMQQASLTLDIFGACGTKDCPKSNMTLCWELIRKEYFFYLSFENSNSIDYVTEKLLYPLNNYAIPIVYGGADYSRFLPPDSYLDATKLTVEELVYKMIEIINSKDMFKKYLRWRSNYKYEQSIRTTICRFCLDLHDPEVMNTTTMYTQFRKWWNPDNLYCMGESGIVMYKTENIENVKLKQSECSQSPNLVSRMLCKFSLLKSKMMRGMFRSHF